MQQQNKNINHELGLYACKKYINMQNVGKENEQKLNLNANKYTKRW